MKRLAKNMTTLVTVCFIIGLVAGCGERKKGVWYRQYLLDINCGDKFRGQIYEMGHTTAGIYSLRYEDEKGRNIDLPNDGCVKITLKELPMPESN